jgi:inner membrane protein
VPSIVAHVWPALAAVPALRRPEIPPRLFVLGALCTIVPDADVAAIPLGVPYGHVLGHRGLSHSIAFAAFFAGLLTLTAFRAAPPGFPRGFAFAYLFLATASHGLLDAATNGGNGVAFFAPFDDGRYHLPFRPIEVSPIGVERFFSDRGVRILANEAVWIGLPSLVFAIGSWVWRRRAAGAAQ